MFRAAVIASLLAATAHAQDVSPEDAYEWSKNQIAAMNPYPRLTTRFLPFDHRSVQVTPRDGCGLSIAANAKLEGGPKESYFRYVLDCACVDGEPDQCRAEDPVRIDLPLNFHPAGTGALWVDTPIGAGGVTGRCAEFSCDAARLPVAVNRFSANAFGVW